MSCESKKRSVHAHTQSPEPGAPKLVHGARKRATDDATQRRFLLLLGRAQLDGLVADEDALTLNSGSDSDSDSDSSSGSGSEVY